MNGGKGWGEKGKVWEASLLSLAGRSPGGAGAAIRPVVDRLRGTQGVAPAILATVVLGLVAGGRCRSAVCYGTIDRRSAAGCR